MAADAAALAQIAARLAEALFGPPTLSRRQIAQQAGMDVVQARRLWQALGFPPVPDDEAIFTPADAAVLSSVRSLITLRGTSEDTVVQQTRVMGQALSRVADAQVAATLERVTALSPEGDTPVALSAALQAIVEQAPQFEQFVVHAWRRHLLAAVLRLAATPSLSEHALVVGFADLSGFTAFSRSIDVQTLAVMVDRFEALAYEHILERGGRVVKTIGDEVMFAVDEARPAAEIALALVEAYGRDAELPNIRVGLAMGPVLAWEGDLYGPTVNLASRLASFARPGAVLLADGLGDQLRDEAAFDLVHLRPVRLKGLGAERAWVLRRTR
ncbi:MAG: adenylate/guanylate cyclase domain-containing protein [bacterium]